MERSRWNRVEERMPLSNGKYWVYPYRNMDGYHMVAMVNFRDGKWDETYSAQCIRYWKLIDVPKPPKTPREKELV